MPHSPRRPCRMNGCPNLAEPGEQYCSEHRKQAEQFYNTYQRPTDRKKYGRAWKRIRDSYIRKHPLCEDCYANGVLKEAEEVHHIVPLSDGGTHDRRNLVALCRSCHQKRHAELGTRLPHSAAR